MSDQESTLPAADGGGDGGGTAKSGRLALAALALVVIAAVAAGVTYLVLRDDSDAESVLLESSAEPGPDPFMDSVSLVDYDGVPEPAREEATATLASLPTDDATGTKIASGSTPGLFGGSRSETTCDVAALTAFLADDDNAALARGFAEVSGIDASGIGSFVTSLTPVLLLGDTAVTNHGFSNGKVTSRQSVLQAGTAVLVDDTGLPRVRCSCGNPLLAPSTTLRMATANTSGAAWSGFERSAVLSPAPADGALSSFTLVDVATGATFERAPGSAPATWVAVSDDGASGTVLVSTDGEEWQTTLETDLGLHGVAHGGGRTVVVGGSPVGGESSGLIVASDNTQTWSEPVRTDVALVDVATSGDTWVALGADRVYTSNDGANWNEQAPLPLEFEGVFAAGIAYGDGEFLVSTHSCGASRCFPAQLLRSSDGVSWSPSPVSSSDTEIIDSAIGYSDGFAVVGYQWLPLASGQSNADQRARGAAARLDGSTMTEIPPSDPGLFLHSLSAADQSWFAVGASTPAGGPDEGRRGIYASDDLAIWARVGSLDAALTDVILIGDTTAPATPAPEPEPAVDGTVVVRAEGVELVGDDGTSTVPYESNAADAIDAISAVLGAPTGTEDIAGDGTCVARSTATEWDELTLVHDGSDAASADRFHIYVADGSRSGRVSTIAGIVPGDPADAAAAQAAPGLSSSAEYEGVQWQWFLLDVPAGDPMEVKGVLVTAQGGLITGLSAPDYLEDMC